MFRRLCQLSALAILGALLVFAPEILTAVSAPYRVQTRERVLLRVVICSQDGKATSALYDALEDFRKANPSVHLRINRADEAQLLTLAEPLPDVYVYPIDSELAPQQRFLPLEVLSEETAQVDEPGLYGTVRYAYVFSSDNDAAPLLCAVCADSQQSLTARALVEFLRDTGDKNGES